MKRVARALRATLAGASVIASALVLVVGGPAPAAHAGTIQQGYWFTASDGGIFTYGAARFQGSAGDLPLVAPVVGMAATDTGGGYWQVASDGGVFSYGTAHFHGSAGGLTLNAPMVGMAPAPTDGGYWLVAADGGVFNYGSARFHGSAGDLTLNAPIVGMAATPTGGGYWLVAADGGVFTYGNAQFRGSAGNLTLNAPIVGMAPMPTGGGYWLVASDGGIFSYGTAQFHGSAGDLTLNAPIVGMAATPTGGGYWFVAADGGLFNYGNAHFHGSAGGTPINAPVVGMSAFAATTTVPGTTAPPPPPTKPGHPTISFITPSTGPTVGGTKVTIEGVGFTRVLSVTFGKAVAASSHVTSPSKITVTTPSHSTGTFTVSVVTESGTAADPTAFTFVAPKVPAPILNVVSPPTGPATGSTSVTLTGAHLTGATSVTFGGVAASFFVTSPNTITATTPAHAIGAVPVKVTTPGGSSTKATGFTYFGPTGPVPVITGINPESGPVTGNTKVTITGTHLTGVSSVTFGTTPALTLNPDSPTHVTVRTPAHAAGPVTVSLTTKGGVASVTTGFTFAIAPPRVSSVLPATGPTSGGTGVTINGADLTGATSVTFGGVKATTFKVVSPTVVTATTPASFPGPVTVAVTTPGGTATKADAFTYFGPKGPRPVITSITPTSGTIAGGTTVTITGTHLTTATSIDFGATPAAGVVSNGTSKIVVTTPPHAPGKVPLTLTTPAGTATAATEFSFVTPTPTIASIIPSTGPTSGGTDVTIHGTHLTGATSVTFGGTVAGTLKVTSPTKATVTTPSHLPGAVQVTVTTPGGTATRNTGFTYFGPKGPSPVITSIDPSSGPVAGGTVVAILGRHFTNATAVMFGTTAVFSFTVDSTSKITVTTKAHAFGKVTVSVTTPAATASDPTGFSFVAPAPSIATIAPATGSSAGGTMVTITGNHLTGASAVTVGGTGASFHVTSPTSITASTPAHTPGVVTIAVTTPGGTARLFTGFTYFGPTGPVPVVSSFSPASGPVAGGTPVTITGTHFTGATAVDFGTTAAATYTVNSPTKITATTAPRAAGKVAVSVTTPGGTASAPTPFSFVAPAPSIATVQPATGPTAGGTSVTITGNHLTGATSVTFGGQTATFHVTSATSLTAKTPAHTPGAVAVAVTTAGGTATKDTGFTYFGPKGPVPTVTSFGPPSGSTLGGTSVTINGTHFTGATAVDFGTTPGASYQIQSPTKISATTPAHAPGKDAVSVTAPGGTASAPTLFTFVAPAPTITTVAPATGPITGETKVTITGNHLTGASSVTFGGTAAGFTLTSPTTITATSPPHALGAADVAVTTPGGTATKATGFTYFGPTGPLPTLASVIPSSGSTLGGTAVTITGTHLTTASAVTFGTTPAASFQIQSPTKISATTPAHAAGKVEVSVTGPGGTGHEATAFNFVAPSPVITSIRPLTGPATGGTAVTITGNHLTGATSVTFGGTGGTFTVTSPSKITATTPAHTLGVVTVAVTTPGGTAKLFTGFTYVGPTGPPPTVTSVIPGSGSTLGGTAVTITGTHFTTATAVTFGTTPAASFQIQSSTKISATTPAHAAGRVTVTVTNPGGPGNDATAFHFVTPSPLIVDVTPSKGTTAGGTMVTITGSHLTGATAVTFGGTAAASFHVTSGSKITTTTPPETAGQVTVTVTTPGGTAVDPTAFTFQ